MNTGNRSKSRWRAARLGVGFAVFAWLAIVVMLQTLGSERGFPVAATEETRSRTEDSDSPRPVEALEAGDRVAVASARTSAAAANAERATGSSIAVRVRTTSGQPWADAAGCVYAFDAERNDLVTAGTFVTDGSGCAEVAVSPGRWVVRIALDPDGYRESSVAPGATAQVDYVVDPGLTIDGLVVDADRVPVGDASISVTILGPDNLRLRAATTGPNGRFRLVVHGSECVVVARARGFATAFKHVQLPEGRAGRLSTELVLLPGSSIRGLVIDARRVPVSGCLVSASSHATAVYETLSPGAESAMSGPDGRFAIDGLSAGPNVVLARADGNLPWRGSIDVLARSSTYCEIELESAGSVVGRVRSERGEPAAGATVIAFAGKRAVARARSNDRGEFSLSPLPLGPTLVWAREPTLGWGRVEIADLRGAGEVEVMLAPGPEVVGRCVDRERTPVPDVSVELRMLDERGRTFPEVLAARTGSDGRFRVAGVAPEVDFWVTAGKPGHADAQGRFGRDDEIELVLPVAVDDCTLKGRVVGPEGEPIAGVSVMVRGSSIGGSYGVASGVDGRFVITDLSRGTLSVTLEHPDFARTVVGDVEAVSGQLELGDLTIRRGGRIRIKASGSSQAPPSGRAYLLDSAGESLSTFELLDGSAVSATVPPGEYQALLMARGYETRGFPVTVIEGTQSDFSVHLRTGEPIVVAFDVPVAPAAAEPVIGTLTSTGQVVYRFVTSRRSLRVNVGEGVYTIDARLGELSGRSEFRRSELPSDGNAATVTLRLEAR